MKTAIAGEDPDWGATWRRWAKLARRPTATGSPSGWATSFAKDGAVASNYREPQAGAYMKGPEIAITVDVGVGKEAATIWTCDLTHDYIAINADYRS